MGSPGGVIVGKGHPHPENCTISDFRQNMKEMVKSDPKLAEMIASDVLKEKINEANTSNSPTISLATKGRNVTYTTPQKPTTNLS